MSDDERKLLDSAGDYRYALRDGEPVSDAAWQSCRIVVTSERLLLATDSDDRSIPLDRLSVPADLPDGVSADGATPVQIGGAVLLVDVPGDEDFVAAYRRAALHDAVVLVDLPDGGEGAAAAAEDGDADWTKARIRVEDGQVALGLQGGGTAELDLESVEAVETGRATVLDQERPTVAVTHADEGGSSTETRFAGGERHARALAGLLRDAGAPDSPAADLGETEREVLLALYSGVSPLEMAAFVGVDVEEVEAIYDRLLAAGVVETVRERTEVALTDEGQTVASAAMNEE